MSLQHILLVDDDQDTQRIVRLTMNHHKIGLTTAIDASEALTAMQQTDFDVVVIDLVLPHGTDGYGLLSLIRKNGYQMRCVAASAYYTSDTAADIRRRGFDGFIAKPFDAAALVTTLESVKTGGSP